MLRCISKNANQLGVFFNTNIRHCHSPLVS
jgi:hypothetical protein